MARVLFDVGIFSVIGEDSEIGIGWLLNFYQANTTTRIATYTEPSAGVANSNPVESDADGRFPSMWIDDDQIIKWILTDEDGAVLMSQDDYSIAAALPDIDSDLDSFLEGTDPLDIPFGGTGETSASNAIAALGGLPTVGGTMTGNITRSTKGVHLYWNAAGQTSGRVFITAAADPDPTSLPGDVWLKY